MVLNICIVAIPTHIKPIAIVVPHEEELKKCAKRNEYEDLQTLCNDKKVIKLVHQELLQSGERGGLRGFELIQGVILVSDEWTP